MRSGWMLVLLAVTACGGGDHEVTAEVPGPSSAAASAPPVPEGRPAASVASAAEGERLDADRAAARALYQEGAVAYDAGDFARAYELFSRANAAYPLPKLRFDVAQAARKLGKRDEACGHFGALAADSSDAALATRAASAMAGFCP